MYDDPSPTVPASIVPKEVVQAFENDLWPGSTQKRSTVPFFGQSIAFAKSADPDDTTFAVESLTFGAFVPQQTKYDSMTSAGAAVLSDPADGADRHSRPAGDRPHDRAGERRLCGAVPP